MSRVVDHLYIGGILEATDKKWLRKHNITLIVNAAKEVPNFFPSTTRYLNLHLYDIPEQSLKHVLDKSYSAIKDEIDRGGNVLVHCFAGISRSSSIVVHYLMRKYHIDYTQAIKYLKSRHPRANPNRGFAYQLSDM